MKQLSVLIFSTLLLVGAAAFAQQGGQPSGEAIYTQSCAQCHGNNGGGGVGPALAGNARLQDFKYHIRQILDGGNGMPSFASQLSDAEIAAVANYERTSWGNDLSEVTVQQVATERNGQSQSQGSQGQQSQQSQQDQQTQSQDQSSSQGQAQSSSANEQDQGQQDQQNQSQQNQQDKQPMLQPAASPVSSGPSQQELTDAASSTETWLMYNKGYDSQRFSYLDQIDRDNVGDLRAVCAFQTGEAGVAFEASPVVYEGILYVTTPHSTYAIGATDCDVVWTHAYTPSGPEPFPTNRGVAIAGGRVFRGTTDGHVIALDAKTGKVLWDVAPVDSAQGYFLSSAPIVWNGLVLTGTAGADWGAPARMFAFDTATGEEVWRFDQIVPDSFGGAEAASTGGASNWTSYTIDRESGLLYVPVGNPAPDFACGYRPGANLYTNSVIVLDAATGDLTRWYQQIPQDCLDRDTAAPPMLFRGSDGHLHMAATSKNGLLYVYDDTASAQADQAPDPGSDAPAWRAGMQNQVQPAQQKAPQQSHGDTLLWTASTTTRTNVDANPTAEGVHVCPGINGGVEWYGAAFDADHHAILTNSVDWCATFTLGEVRYAPGRFFFGGSFSFDPVTKSSGWLKSFDAESGQELWAYQSTRPLVAAVTPTAGGLIFTGELTGDFIALDSGSGEVLYRFNTGGPIAAGISTYEQRGTQYVAVASGNASRTWNPDAGAAATVFVFALPD